MLLTEKFDHREIESSLSLYVDTESTILNKLNQSLKDEEVNNVVDVIDHFMTEGQIIIDSPCDGSRSVAIASSNKAGAHYLLMKSDVGNNYWIIVQAQSFIDCIILPDKAYYIFDKMLGKNAVSGLREALEEFETLRSSSGKFSGMHLDSARPYHYFYDNLKSLIFLKNKLKNEVFNKYSHSVQNSFWDISNIVSDFTVADSSKIYLKPSLISQNVSNASNSEWSKSAMESMEHMLIKQNSSANVQRLSDKKKYELILWIGVTGQKRSWIEQVSGYSSIINRLYCYFPKMLVVVDGLTAIHGAQDLVPEDVEVFNKIKARCKKDIDFINLIGRDYSYKISICDQVDFFISNAGTGSMIPLRFSQKSGVLHSNHSIYTFPDDYEARGQDVRKVDDASVKEERLDDEPTMFVSYHISWKEIYNLLIAIINNQWNLDLKTLAITEEDSQSNQIDGLMAIKLVNKRLQQKSILKDDGQLVEVLKELSVGFEKSGELELAQSLMLRALSLRPNGKYIKRKVIEYTSLLEKDE